MALRVGRQWALGPFRCVSSWLEWLWGGRRLLAAHLSSRFWWLIATGVAHENNRGEGGPGLLELFFTPFLPHSEPWIKVSHLDCGARRGPS